MNRQSCQLWWLLVLLTALVLALSGCSTPQSPAPPPFPDARFEMSDARFQDGPVLAKAGLLTTITVEWTIPAPNIIGQTLTRETGLVTWPDGEEIVVLTVTEPTGWVGSVNGQAVTWTPMDQRFTAILPVRNDILVRSFAR